MLARGDLELLGLRASLIIIGALAACAHTERVPLRANFNGEELALTATVGATATLLAAFEDPIVEALGPPAIGPPPAFDRAVSDAAHRPGEGPWLARIPDYSAVIWPAVTMSVYLTDAMALWLRGRTISGDPNADHKLLTFVEALIWTTSTTELAKVLVRRERPRWALERPDAGERTSWSVVSFWSGHSAISMCVAAVLTRDVGERALAGRPAVVRYLLPGLLFYGAAAFVGVSRVVDQEHYLTDVLIGSAFGALVGNLVYATHFDAQGRPRRRFPLTIVPVEGGVGVVGTF